MISWLQGRVVEKSDSQVTLDVHGVGYEVFCSTRTVDSLGDSGNEITLYTYAHYKSDGSATLFGFLDKVEKELFLNLIKVDSVGPKSALNILSAGPWDETISFIEEGDVAALTGLPKISKKTAEHVVVKLKGKLSDLVLLTGQRVGVTRMGAASQARLQAQTALVHLGYKPHEVARAIEDLPAEVLNGDLQSIIRSALNDLSGNN